jgi:hypothetical protein
MEKNPAIYVRHILEAMADSRNLDKSLETGIFVVMQAHERIVLRLPDGVIAEGTLVGLVSAPWMFQPLVSI